MFAKVSEGQLVDLPLENTYLILEKNYRITPWTYSRLSIPESAYKPLRYLSTTAQVRGPKKIICDSVAFYLEPYEVPLAMTSVEGAVNQFSGPLPEMEYSIRVVKDGKEIIIPFRKIRKHLNKRKQVLKMKIRKRDLIIKEEPPTKSGKA